jgi:hypothetical protein
MSILSALKETTHQSDNILDLAKLPQALIMQMAQNGQIPKDMVMPILGKKAEMVENTAKMNAAKQLAAQGGVQPTVMEKYMGEIAAANHPALPMPQQQMQQPMQQMPQQMAQAPMPQGPEDVGIASQATQPMSMAGGGIIAFGDGGDVDDEDIAYDMAREESDMNMGSSIGDVYKMARHGIKNLMSKLPESYESAKSKVASYVMPEGKSGSHPLEAKAIAIANQVGLDPRLMLHALHKESGGLKDPETAQSKAGAYGPMQLMAGTAKELGVDRKNVDQNLYGGAIYLKQMLDKYKDPQLALAAYNAGPGRVDKALRSQAGLSALPRETQGYMRYAQGGEIRHFYEGDYVDPMGSSPVITEPGMGSFKSAITGSPENLLANGKITEKEYNEIQRRKEASRPKEAPKTTAKGPDLQSVFANHTAQQQANPDRDVFAEMVADNAARRADINASAKEDRNLALLASGLGMLGGTSQYWSENVGKGGLKGVEAMAGSKTRRAAELNALSNAELKALYYGQENKRKQQALTEGMRDKDLDNLAQYDAKLRKQFFMEGVTPSAKQLEAYEMAKRTDPLYQILTKNTGVYSSPAPQGRTIDFSSIR